MHPTRFTARGSKPEKQVLACRCFACTTHRSPGAHYVLAHIREPFVTTTPLKKYETSVKTGKKTKLKRIVRVSGCPLLQCKFCTPRHKVS